MSKIIYSESFLEFLKTNAKTSKVCDILYRIYLKYDNFSYYKTNIIPDEPEVNYITFRKDGTISYLPKGKEAKYTNTGEWSREGRQNGKAGKVIRKLFTKRAIERLFTDSDFELFANTYKSTFNDDGYNFSILPNSKIPSVYGMGILSGEGSLNNSCMNGDISYLDIYKNCPHLSILIMTNKDGLLCGRALVWQLGDSITFMDRIYVVRDFMYENFLSYCADKKWWRKNNYKSFQNKMDLIDPNGDSQYKRLKVYTDTDFDEYPYIDTFTYGNDGYLTNDNDYDTCYTYDETDGTREGGKDEHEGQVWDDIDECYIDEDDSVYIEYGERRFRGRITHQNNTVWVGDDRYHQDDENIVEVNDNWYRKDDDDIVFVESEDEYYLREDCDMNVKDDQFYPSDELVYSKHEGGYILKSEAYEVAGEYYHEDDVQRAA